MTLVLRCVWVREIETGNARSLHTSGLLPENNASPLGYKPDYKLILLFSHLKPAMDPLFTCFHQSWCFLSFFCLVLSYQVLNIVVSFRFCWRSSLCLTFHTTFSIRPHPLSDPTPFASPSEEQEDTWVVPLFFFGFVQAQLQWHFFSTLWKILSELVCPADVWAEPIQHRDAHGRGSGHCWNRTAGKGAADETQYRATCVWTLRAWVISGVR